MAVLIIRMILALFRALSASLAPLMCFMLAHLLWPAMCLTLTSRSIRLMQFIRCNMTTDIDPKIHTYLIRKRR